MTELASNLDSQEDFEEVVIDEPSVSDDIMSAFGELEDDQLELDSSFGDEDSEEKETSRAAPKGKAAPDIEVPEHWSPADKEMVTALAETEPEAAKWLMDQKKNIEKDAQAKWQEAANMRKQNEYAINLAQHTSQMLRGIIGRYPPHAGMNEGKAVQMMAAWWDGLTNPQTRQQAFQDLASQLGINPSGEAEDEDLDPTVKALMSEIQQLKGNQQQATTQQQAQIWQQQQAAYQAQQSQAGNTIQQFMSEADESGALKHPHFNKVQSMMGVLLKADMEAGGSMDLEKAYQIAVAQEGLPNESPAARLRKAKRAASGVRSKRGSNSDGDVELSDRDLIAGIINGDIF